MKMHRLFNSFTDDPGHLQVQSIQLEERWDKEVQNWSSKLSRESIIIWGVNNYLRSPKLSGESNIIWGVQNDPG